MPSPAHIQAPLWPAFLVFFTIAHFKFWCLWSLWTWSYSAPEGFWALLHSTIFVTCMAGGVWLFVYINYTSSYAGQDASSFLALWACSTAVVDVAYASGFMLLDGRPSEPSQASNSGRW